MPKVGEVLQVSKMPHYYQRKNNYKVDVDYGNPLNLNGSTVGHLDMNACEYTVEISYVNPQKPIATICRAIRLFIIIPLDDHGNDENDPGPNVECIFPCTFQDLRHFLHLVAEHIWF
jgi:hypothetical protein